MAGSKRYDFSLWGFLDKAPLMASVYQVRYAKRNTLHRNSKTDPVKGDVTEIYYYYYKGPDSK